MLILSTHHVRDPRAFLPPLYEALANTSHVVRMRQSLLGEDHTRVSFLWEAASREAVQEFFVGFAEPTLLPLDIVAILDPLPPPVITWIFPFSVIRPRGGVILQGTHFMDQPGELLLLGNFPGGQLSLTDLQWRDTDAAGVIPDVTAVPDQDASLQIITRRGTRSNVLPVKFEANREVALLPHSALKVIYFDEHGWGSDSDSYTLDASHFGGLGDFSSGDGHDVYQCTLLNGWVFSHYEWGTRDGVNGGPFGQSSDPVGSSSFTIDVHWFYDVLGSANYQLKIFVVGPAGIAFQ